MYIKSVYQSGPRKEMPQNISVDQYVNSIIAGIKIS